MVLAEHTRFAPELMAMAEQKQSPMSIASFLNGITESVEKGDLSEALSFYDKHRQHFSERIPELGQVDTLLATLRAKMQKVKR